MAFYCTECGEKATYIEYSTVVRQGRRYLRPRYLCEKHARSAKAVPVDEEKTVLEPRSYIP